LKTYSIIFTIIAVLLLVAVTIPATYSTTTYTVEYHVKAQVTKNSNPPETILLTDYKIRYNIKIGDKEANICYNISGPKPPFKSGEICRAINISDLPEAFNTPRGVELSFPVIRLNNMSIIYDYNYTGETTYNGVHVYVLKARVYTPFYCGITNKISTIYVYKGLPIPLYASIYYAMCEKYQIQVTAQTVVLPKDTIGAHIDTQRYSIIIGGLNGAHVVINGDKGTNWLKAINDGSQPAYIMVLYRNHGTLLLRILPPGETVMIELPVALAQTVNVEAGVRQSIGTSFYIALSVAVFAAAVVAMVYLIPRKYMASK